MAPKKPSKSPAAVATVPSRPQNHGYEFGGPIGVTLMSIGLPFLVYLFAFFVNDVAGCPPPSLLSPGKLFARSAFSTKSGWERGLQTIGAEVGWPSLAGLVNANAVLGTLFWYGLTLFLYTVLPAEEVEGTELRSGGRLKYRLNSFLSAATIVVACIAGTWLLGADFPVWTFIERNYIQIITCNIAISFALATYVYVASFQVQPGNVDKRELAAGGCTGNIIYDWFIGRELNPRITLPVVGEVDIKSFMELRPGMLGWVMLDLAFAAKQYRSYGYVSDSMLIVVLSQAVYVFDALWMEPAILTTIDITTDGFGLMLAFGDLVWVPFVYSIQARYLSVHPIVLGPLYVLLILGVQLSGYYIFRASNNEKNRFRTNPSDPAVAHLDFIQTSAGSKLITSGWWGTARHINYLGDWLMSWAYCLPTLAAGYKLTPSVLSPGSRLVSTEGMAGWAMPITYFYMLYFAILLIHRAIRDDDKCRKKYGADWELYCEKVRWKIVPGLY